jgi:hypothetical protein
MSSVTLVILKNTYMWWVVYPETRPVDAKLASMNFVGEGGMGGFNNAPVFISEDALLLKNRFGGKGAGGERTFSEIERRCYLPQWFWKEN